MIRRIKAEDASAIMEICIESLGHATDEEILRTQIEKLKDNPSYYIAVYADESSEKAVSFIEAESYSLIYGGDGWNIIALAVKPDFQRKGIGQILLSSLEEKAEAAGNSFIRLNSRVERNEAHAFYLASGYTCDKTQKRFIKYLK